MVAEPAKNARSGQRRHGRSHRRVQLPSCSTSLTAITTEPSTDANCAAGSTARISPRPTPTTRTLDKNEFLALVEKRFKSADPDNDGTIDAKEFKSAAGRSLVQLLK